METLIGFMIGYVVGTRQGRDGLRKVRDSVDAIRNSPEVSQMVSGGISVAGSMVKQVLSGGAGPLIANVIDAVSRKTDEMFGDEDRDAA